eukprot:8951694-Pyramimonas_sp.AAC.2
MKLPSSLRQRRVLCGLTERAVVPPICRTRQVRDLGQRGEPPGRSNLEPRLPAPPPPAETASNDKEEERGITLARGAVD